jgi:hypothetical protein
MGSVKQRTRKIVEGAQGEGALVNSSRPNPFEIPRRDQKIIVASWCGPTYGATGFGILAGRCD